MGPSPFEARPAEEAGRAPQGDGSECVLAERFTPCQGDGSRLALAAQYKSFTPCQLRLRVTGHPLNVSGVVDGRVRQRARPGAACLSETVHRNALLAERAAARQSA